MTASVPAETTSSVLPRTATNAPSLRQNFKNVLSDEILNHRWIPGQRLIEREIVAQFGVSRATVREAIGALAAEGLVTVLPQRGAIVTESSVDDALDLYASRSALEVLLIRKFMERAAIEHRDRLLASVVDLAQIVAAGADASTIMAQRDSFYGALFAGAQSPVLAGLVEGVQARVRVLCASSLSERGRSTAAALELSNVVSAIRADDGDRAVALMERHLELAAEATVRTLPHAA